MHYVIKELVEKIPPKVIKLYVEINKKIIKEKYHLLEYFNTIQKFNTKNGSDTGTTKHRDQPDSRNLPP